jgi:hypothetical protein
MPPITIACEVLRFCPAQEFFTCIAYGDVTIAGEGLHLGVCSALRACEHREESLSCHTYYDLGPQFFRFHPKARSIQCPLMTRKRCWGPILTRTHGSKNNSTTSKYTRTGRISCRLMKELEDETATMFHVLLIRRPHQQSGRRRMLSQSKRKGDVEQVRKLSPRQP